MCVEQSQWRIHHDDLPPYLIQIDFHESVIMCTLIWYKDISMLLRQRCYVCIARKGREREGKEMGESGGGGGGGERWSWREEKIAH